jgi:hypothetical protein
MSEEPNVPCSLILPCAHEIAVKKGQCDGTMDIIMALSRENKSKCVPQYGIFTNNQKCYEPKNTFISWKMYKEF